MKDNSTSAIKVATDYFDKGYFTATRWCPGAMPGEWMVVDDNKQQLVVVHLGNSPDEQVDDGYEYELNVARYNDELNEWTN